MKNIPFETNAVAKKILDASFAVHRALGPGLLESVYEFCLVHELNKLHTAVARQVRLPILYDGMKLGAALRMDLVAGGRVIVELKSVDALAPIHTAQMLTYLKLSGLRLGLLINFNVPVLHKGIRRIAL
ncbi:MAG: GxxExxY protein [Deltaproteobacteria bacterium]|nr:GxxExxY protein [Deltaproteobacteria bacterium]